MIWGLVLPVKGHQASGDGRLKMWQGGEVMDAEVALNIQDEMPSGSEAVLDDSWVIRQCMPLTVQRSSSGQR